MNYNLDKSFARKLHIMVDSKLIWYKHYELWCDEIIELFKEPPYWIIELSSAKYYKDAMRAISDYIQSEPFDEYSWSDLANFFIACLYIRYERREISWATFLLITGEYADKNKNAKKGCEYFYDLLNKYDDSFYSIRVEKSQRKVIENLFDNYIIEARAMNKTFKKYYIRYIKLHEK